MLLKKLVFLKKVLQMEIRCAIITEKQLNSLFIHGRLAQLVEHSLDVRVVRDSSSLSSTN